MSIIAIAKVLIINNDDTTVKDLAGRLVDLGIIAGEIIRIGEQIPEEIDQSTAFVVLLDFRLADSEPAQDIQNRFSMPVIVTSGVSDTEKAKALISERLYSHLVTPTTESSLKAVIEPAMQIAAARAAQIKAEAALQASMDRTHRQGTTIAGLALNDAITSGRKEEALNLLMTTISDMMNVDRASVWLLSDDQRSLVCHTLYERNDNRFSEGITLDVADYPRYFEAIHSTNRVCAADALTNPRTREFTEVYFKPNDIVSMLDAGIHIDGELAGIVCLECTGEKRLWHLEDESLASIIAAFVGQTISNAQRRAVENSLRESEKRFWELVEFLPQPVFEIDNRTILTYANRVAYEVFKYSQEEFDQGLPVMQMIAPEDRDRAAANIVRILNDEDIGGVEYTLVRKNGETFPVLLYAGKILVSGVISGIRGVIFDITDQKKAEAELQASEKKYRQIFENAQNPYYEASLDGRLLEISPSVERYLRYSRQELIGMSLLDLYAHPEQRDRIVEQIISSGDYINEEIDVLDKDGRIVNAMLYSRFVPEENKFIGSLFDITERKQSEEKIRQLRIRLDDIINSMPTVLIGVDADFRITNWNIKSVEVTGIPVDSALGRRFESVLPHYGSLLDSMRTAVSRRSPEKFIKYSREVNQMLLYEDITIYPLSAEVTEGAVILIDDVTERVRMEEMMIQTEKMMSVGGLAAGMAHELNNPLGGMLQGLQNVERRLSSDLKSNLKPALESGVDLEKLQSYLKKRDIFRTLDGIRESGRKASHIISNMLQFSRKSESRMAPVDIVATVEKTLELAHNEYNLKKQFDFKHINVIKSYESNLPPVRCTETEIEQVILNLLNNATWAMTNEKQQDSPRIEIRVYRSREMVNIEIEDNGPGMTEVVRKRIFEPFYTTKPVGVGTGLGLSVSFMIITNNHRGRLEVESEPGAGARFIISLPIDPEESAGT